MKRLVWVLLIAAGLALIAGLAVNTLGFLLGVAPVLAFVAVVLWFLNRRGGRRIPR